MMMGFWNDPEATESRMRDGCVLTGDIGRLAASQGSEWRPTDGCPLAGGIVRLNGLGLICSALRHESAPERLSGWREQRRCSELEL